MSNSEIDVKYNFLQLSQVGVTHKTVLAIQWLTPKHPQIVFQEQRKISKNILQFASTQYG